MECEKQGWSNDGRNRKKDGGGKGADCGISVWVLQESNISVYQELARVP